jgi:hypothetical protein
MSKTPRLHLYQLDLDFTAQADTSSYCSLSLHPIIFFFFFFFFFFSLASRIIMEFQIGLARVFNFARVLCIVLGSLLSFHSSFGILYRDLLKGFVLHTELDFLFCSEP